MGLKINSVALSCAFHFSKKDVALTFATNEEKHCYANGRSPHHNDLGFSIMEIMWQQSYIAASS